MPCIVNLEVLLIFNINIFSYYSKIYVSYQLRSFDRSSIYFLTCRIFCPLGQFWPTTPPTRVSTGDNKCGNGGPESTEIQKKCLGLAPIFFDQVYPKEQKNAHMEIFYPCPGEKNQFFKFMY